ncbi:WG repeat-containing protein [Anoxynatronum buryatiense]|uniref:WG containing repeat-containing protein n=1 Tax=Anoxynatronum buryatiense TaxID=489973 RepID=A0AA45WWT6_9CLOT|nr:WG repeat-containing protein [Anoxynatronum buryatiense]SMP60719.1 WG containing repeat-containing protein [Anoxynatronum buryatiense]
MGFSEIVFPAINEERFAVLYSDKAASRPNAPVNAIVGALILKEMFALTDEDLLESILCDVRFQVALRSTSFKEQPFSDRTFSRFRERLYHYELETGEDLLKDEMEALAETFRQYLGIEPTLKRMDSLMVSSNGYYLLPVSVDSQWGFMNTSGEIVIEPVFQQVLTFSDNGLAPVQVDNLWGLINTKGESVVEPQFDYMHHQFSMGLIGAGIVEPGEIGFLNKDGNWAIAPTGILAGHFNEEGLAVFSMNEQYGMMDINRNILIEPIYDFVFDTALLDWEQAPFLLNGQWGSMNRQGEVVTEAMFDSLFHFDKAGMARIESHEGYSN